MTKDQERERAEWIATAWMEESMCWQSPGLICQEFVDGLIVCEPRDLEKMAALEQTWAIWKGLA